MLLTPWRSSNRAQERVDLCDVAEKLGLENKFALLILFRRLVCLVVFPSNDLGALAAGDVSNDVATGGHVALARIAGVDIDDIVEEICLTVLAAKVL
jgi:hypothetical protein